MVVVVDKKLEHVLEFLHFSSREARTRSVRVSMMEKMAIWSQKRGLSWRYLSRGQRRGKHRTTLFRGQFLVTLSDILVRENVKLECMDALVS